MTKKKNKLSSLDQVDAKNVNQEPCFRNLDALIGEDNSNPYKTFELSAYEAYISELNSTDLHRHAQKVGLVPNVDRRVLKDRLVREFKRFVAARTVNLTKTLGQTDSFQTVSLSKEVQKILREGS